jgi:hypothetical protein
MRAGKLIRALAAHDAADAKLCVCEHELGRHYELPRELPPATVEQIANPVPNPDFVAGHFHCNVEGCSCVLDRSAG